MTLQRAWPRRAHQGRLTLPTCCLRAGSKQRQGLQRANRPKPNHTTLHCAWRRRAYQGRLTSRRLLADASHISACGRVASGAARGASGPAGQGSPSSGGVSRTGHHASTRISCCQRIRSMCQHDLQLASWSQWNVRARLPACITVVLTSCWVCQVGDKHVRQYDFIYPLSLAWQ